MSGWAGDFVVPGSLGCTEGSEPEFASCFGSGKNSSAVYLVFEFFVGLLVLLLMLTIPVFFHILANGTIWSSTTLLWFWCCCTGGWLILFLGFNLYRWFRICGSHGIISRGNWPIFPQFKKIARHFSCHGPRSTSANWGIF